MPTWYDVPGKHWRTCIGRVAGRMRLEQALLSCRTSLVARDGMLRTFSYACAVSIHADVGMMFLENMYK